MPEEKKKPGRPKKENDDLSKIVSQQPFRPEQSFKEENPIDKVNKDDFLRQLEKTRREAELARTPKMKVALVRKGAIFQKANNDDGNAGYDLKAFNMTIEDGYIKFMLGVKTETPKGYYWEVVHRSSNSKFNFILANTKGTIDSNFRGEWQARIKIIPQPEVYPVPTDGFANFSKEEVRIQQHIGSQYVNLWKEGEIALQAILHKIPDHQIEFVDESELSNTERGEGGHGSTGNGLDKLKAQYPVKSEGAFEKLGLGSGEYDPTLK